MFSIAWKSQIVFAALSFLNFPMAPPAQLTSWTDFFQPLADCYPIATVRDLELSPVLQLLPEGILISLNWLESPFEIRKMLPDYRTSRQIRRLGSHCMIHMIFPAFHLGGTFYLDEYSATDQKRISHHQFSIFAIFFSRTWRNKWAFDRRRSLFCLIPLNYIALEYKGGALLRAYQLRLECPNGGRICWELLLLTPRGIGDVRAFLGLLEKGRRDFHGASIEFKLPHWLNQDKLKSLGAWNGWISAYRNAHVTKLMPVLAFSKMLNASIVPIQESMEPAKYCSTNYVVANERFWSLWTSELMLMHSEGYKFMYAEEPEEKSAWRLRCLLAPVATSTALMFVLAICLYALVNALDRLAANGQVAIFFMLRSLWGQSWDGSMSQPWSFYMFLWSISTWFLTTKYTTVLQSIVVIPEVKSGDLTLEGILNRNLTVFASRVDIEEYLVKFSAL